MKLKNLFAIAMCIAIPIAAAAAERVNLWPLFYADGGDYSLAWPIVTKDSDHFAIRPIYSCYGGTEHNVLWPLMRFETSVNSNHILPFFWGDGYSCLFPVYLWHDGSDKLFSSSLLYWHAWDRSWTVDTLFPLWWYESHNNGRNKTFWCAAGLAGGKANEKGIWEHWLLPLYYYDPDTFLSPVWYDNKSNGERTRAIPPLLAAHVAGKERSGVFSPWFSSWRKHTDNSGHGSVLMGLAGWDAPANGPATMWSVPFFYRDEYNFATPFWVSGEKDGESWTIVPPLLSGTRANSKKGEKESRYLMGLAGTNSNTNGLDEAWLFPAFYKSNDTFITPIYGQTADSRWLFPVWYNSRDTFVSLPWAHHRDESGKIDWAVCPPLLSSFAPGSARLFAGLAGWTEDSSWVMPFYYKSPDTTLITPLAGFSDDAHWIFPLYYSGDDAFASPLWYCRRYSKGAFQWCIPPLLMSYSQNRKHDYWDFYSFPLFSIDSNGNFSSIPYIRKVGGDFQRTVEMMGSDRLPDEIKVWDEVYTNYQDKVKIRREATSLYDRDKRTFLLVAKHNKHSYGQIDAASNYTFTARISAGNDLLMSRDKYREVKFSTVTREKLKETRSKTIKILAGGLLFDWEEKLVKKADGSGSHTCDSSFLVWLWRREEKDGNVKVDAFPGFTHDSRPDGYSKTSFLWRFFRYEKNPGRGTSVDFLFLPVWR